MFLTFFIEDYIRIKHYFFKKSWQTATLSASIIFKDLTMGQSLFLLLMVVYIHFSEFAHKFDIVFWNIGGIFAKILRILGCIYMNTFILSFALLSHFLQSGVFEKYSGWIGSRLFFGRKMIISPQVGGPVDIVLLEVRVGEHVLILSHVLTHDVIMSEHGTVLGSITKNRMKQSLACAFDGVWFLLFDFSVGNVFFHFIITFRTQSTYYENACNYNNLYNNSIKQFSSACKTRKKSY